MNGKEKLLATVEPHRLAQANRVIDAQEKIIALCKESIELRECEIQRQEKVIERQQELIDKFAAANEANSKAIQTQSDMLAAMESVNVALMLLLYIAVQSPR